MNDAAQLFRQATERLQYAQEELNRPDEDVMAFAVCHQVRTVLAEMMSSYLMMKGRDFSGATNLEDLRKLSEEFDNRFKQLDLESMVCHPGDLKGEKCYCMDLDRVRTCLDIADECRKIVGAAL